jgi:two-component system chemotaxis response regulator CheB
VTSSYADPRALPDPANPVSVVVVAATHVRLDRLVQLIGSAGILVLATARTVDDAVLQVREHRPDVVVLDLALSAGGLELVERVMGRCPTPIVLTGAAVEGADLALAAGAVDVVPLGTETQGSVVFARSLARHVRLAARVRVITHPRGRLRERGLGVSPPAVPVSPSDDRRRPPLVVIGASTGGPPALAALLAALPADLPAAVLVVQHMAEGFVEGLASWLGDVSALPVSVALHGDRLRRGHVVLAPSDGNVVVEQGLRMSIEAPREGQFHVPEIDRSFRSAASVCRERAVGVLLTGMGRDGAAGLLSLRRAGALTIGQDELTSVVWGMPAAAVALDAVEVQLPLPRIASAVVEAVARLSVAEAV